MRIGVLDLEVICKQKTTHADAIVSIYADYMCTCINCKHICIPK